MKKLTHLGCLLALVFAGASAFADSWFNGFTAAGGIDIDEEQVGSWKVPQGDTTKWDKLASGAYYLNDWDHGAVFTAKTEKVVSDADSKITTTVKFTAMDPEDLGSYDISGAKAGVTLVELGANSYQFKVIQWDSAGETNRWVDVLVEPLKAIPNAIPVTVEFIKIDAGANVKYTIGTIDTATPIEYALKDASLSIQSVEYRGQCELTPDLTGLAWSNKANEPSTVVVDPPTGYVGPTTIKYNHEDLKARFAEKGFDANNDAAVIAYMTGKQANGQFGWVNYALGQEDNEDVCVSNTVEGTEGKLSFNFGFVVDDDNYAVTYSVDGGTSAQSAEVGIDSGVHTIAVTVKDKNGNKTYDVTNQVVGVMQAKSPASEGKKTGTKVYEIVAVPWEAFGHTLVTVENLLVTSLLTDGDTLYVWNNEGYYDTYKLTEGAWVAQLHTSFSSQTGAVTKEGTSATENTLAQGTAVWIEHDVASKIVFTGMLKDDSPASTVTKTINGGDRDTWTLIANPSINAFDFSGIGAVGDRIVIEDAADPREYECKMISDEKVWGYDKKVKKGTRTIRDQTIDVYSTEWTVADPIPAGIGFWYVRKAGGTDFNITFGDNDVAE